MEAGEPNSAAWNVYKLESFLDAFPTWVKVEVEDASLLVILVISVDGMFVKMI